jgi:hypothetical protein
MGWHDALFQLLDVCPPASTAEKEEETMAAHLAPIRTKACASWETLVRVYHARHGFGAVDRQLFAHSFALAGLCLRAATEASVANSETERGIQAQLPLSTFLLCARAVHGQGQNNYVAVLMFSLLASLVESAGLALGAELDRIRNQCQVPAVSTEHVHMDWTVYEWANPEGKGLSALVEGLEGLAVEEREKRAEEEGSELKES